MEGIEQWVHLPSRVIGPSLTAAGLAAWVLAKNGRGVDADATRELQDVLDDALRSGEAGAVPVPRSTVERAASLWEAAAGLLESSVTRSPTESAAATREAARLRARISSLHKALDEE